MNNEQGKIINNDDVEKAGESTAETVKMVQIISGINDNERFIELFTEVENQRIKVKALADEVVSQKNEVANQRKDIDKQKDFMHVVVIVLLVMVAAIVIDVLLAKISNVSYEIGPQNAYERIGRGDHFFIIRQY